MTFTGATAVEPAPQGPLGAVVVSRSGAASEEGAIAPEAEEEAGGEAAGEPTGETVEEGRTAGVTAGAAGVESAAAGAAPDADGEGVACDAAPGSAMPGIADDDGRAGGRGSTTSVVAGAADSHQLEGAKANAAAARRIKAPTKTLGRLHVDTPPPEDGMRTPERRAEEVRSGNSTAAAPVREALASRSITASAACGSDCSNGAGSIDR